MRAGAHRIVLDHHKRLPTKLRVTLHFDLRVEGIKVDMCKHPHPGGRCASKRPTPYIKQHVARQMVAMLRKFPSLSVSAVVHGRARGCAARDLFMSCCTPLVTDSAVQQNSHLPTTHAPLSSTCFRDAQYVVISCCYSATSSCPAQAAAAALSSTNHHQVFCRERARAAL